MKHHSTNSPSVLTTSLLAVIATPILFSSCLLNSSKPQTQPTPKNKTDKVVSNRPQTKASKDPQPYKIIRKSGPELLTFDELKSLSKDPNPTGNLKKKFDTLLSTPFIDNSAYFKSGMPSPRTDKRIGKAIRVSTWNVEKSVRIPEVAKSLTSSEYFLKNMRPEIASVMNAKNDALRQRASLAASDVLLLQEMDIGHCRSGYIFAAEHMAKKLNMNFVYASHQLEVDPVYLGTGEENIANKKIGHAECHTSKGIEENYKGVFGVAVLSRYPIKRAQIFQLDYQAYDWHTGEAKKTDLLESMRKLASQKLFRFKPVRELKVGGRGFTRVDLQVPGLPHETLSIINVHLEIKTTPKKRARQMKEILGYIKDIRNPVVMAGDFNSSATDVSSTSFFKFGKKTTTNPTNLFSAGLLFADISGVSQARRAANAYKNFRNPLAYNLPLILPNKVKSLFKSVENFRFDDGGAFDFRGDLNRSSALSPCSKKLANSNMRHPSKGFTFTFAVPRPLGFIGKDRLDWMFVKSFLKDSNEENAPYRLSPHFGETLGLMNLAVKEPFSDHDPITVLLPLEEPKIQDE